MQKLVNILLKIAYVHTSVFNCLTEVFCGLEFCGLCSKNALLHCCNFQEEALLCLAQILLCLQLCS